MCLLFYRKKLNGLFGQPNSSSSSGDSNKLACTYAVLWFTRLSAVPVLLRSFISTLGYGENREIMSVLQVRKFGARGVK